MRGGGGGPAPVDALLIRIEFGSNLDLVRRLLRNGGWGWIRPCRRCLIRIGSGFGGKFATKWGGGGGVVVDPPVQMLFDPDLVRSLLGYGACGLF